MTTTKVRDIRIFDGEDFDLWKMELKACLMKHEIEDILEPGYVLGNNADEKTSLQENVQQSTGHYHLITRQD